ncbi:unknown protein [Microcystis aeruginosa NIES-843]|uniref:Uncharacterized protein n=1 Tax=Microcystis aeruginosa (strain NIES-843 / IAM M-2473) TaxID=449447 RepID=B0JW41_MICAN|nr:unknown protein [Microcystis aeruginosa NIES-843]
MIIKHLKDTFRLELRFFGLCYAMSFSIRDETLIEKDIDAIFVNCFRSRTN